MNRDSDSMVLIILSTLKSKEEFFFLIFTRVSEPTYGWVELEPGFKNSGSS